MRHAATLAAMDQCELDDINRRIRNIADSHPQDSWSLDEAKAVLATLSGIVRVRQGDGDVGLRVVVSLTESAAQVVDELVVWEIGRRSENLDNAGYLTGLKVSGGDQCLDRALA